MKFLKSFLFTWAWIQKVGLFNIFCRKHFSIIKFLSSFFWKVFLQNSSKLFFEKVYKIIEMRFRAWAELILLEKRLNTKGQTSAKKICLEFSIIWKFLNKKNISINKIFPFVKNRTKSNKTTEKSPKNKQTIPLSWHMSTVCVQSVCLSPTITFCYCSWCTLVNSSFLFRRVPFFSCHFFCFSVENLGGIFLTVFDNWHHSPFRIHLSHFTRTFILIFARCRNGTTEYFITEKIEKQ